MLISFFLVIIISTSLTVRGQPSPRFHVEAWLPFKNCEMDYFKILVCYDLVKIQPPNEPPPLY